MTVQIQRAEPLHIPSYARGHAHSGRVVMLLFTTLTLGLVVMAGYKNAAETSKFFFGGIDTSAYSIVASKEITPENLLSKQQNVVPWIGDYWLTEYSEGVDPGTSGGLQINAVYSHQSKNDHVHVLITDRESKLERQIPYWVNTARIERSGTRFVYRRADKTIDWFADKLESKNNVDTVHVIEFEKNLNWKPGDATARYEKPANKKHPVVKHFLKVYPAEKQQRLR